MAVRTATIVSEDRLSAVQLIPVRRDVDSNEGESKMRSA